VHSADEHDHAGKLDAIGSILLPDLSEYGIYTPTPRAASRRSSTEDFASGVYGRAPTSSGVPAFRWLVLPDGSEIEMPHVELTIAVHLTADGYSAIPLETGPTCTGTSCSSRKSPGSWRLEVPARRPADPAPHARYAITK